MNRMRTARQLSLQVPVSNQPDDPPQPEMRRAKLRHQQIEEAESAASASADEQYAEIAALSLERDAAQAAYQSAEKHTAPPRLSISPVRLIKATYLQGEASYLQKKAELETAEISCGRRMMRMSGC